MPVCDGFAAMRGLAREESSARALSHALVVTQRGSIMRKGAKDAFTSRRYRELMQNTSFECYRQIDTNPSEDVAISAHHHAFYEIIFVISGDFFYEVEGRPYHLSRGDVILIDELQFHHGQIYHSQGYQRYALWIHPQYMQRLARRFPKLDPQYCFLQLNSENNNLVHLDDASFAELKADLAHLFDCFWSKTPSDEVLSESYFAIILTRLNQIVHRQHSDEEIPTISASDQVPANIFTHDSFNLQGLDAITAHYAELAPGAPADVSPAAAPSGSLAALSPNYGTPPEHVVQQALLSTLNNTTLPPQSTWDHKGGAPFMKPLAPSAHAYQPDHGLGAQDTSLSPGYEAVHLHDVLEPILAPTLLNFTFELKEQAAQGPYVGSALGFKLNEASLNPFIISIASPQLAVFSKWLNADIHEVARPYLGPNLCSSEAQLSIAREATLAALKQLDEQNVLRPAVQPNATVQLEGTAILGDVTGHTLPLSFNDNSARIVYQGLKHWTFKTYDGVSLNSTAPQQGLGLSPEQMPLTLNFAGSCYQITDLSLYFDDDPATGDGAHPAPLEPVERGNDEDDRQLDLTRNAYPYQGQDLTYLQGTAAVPATVNLHPSALGVTTHDSTSFTPQRFSNFTAELAAQATAAGAQDDDEMHLNLKLSESLKLSAILKYINQNINENLSLDELARRFSLSKFYLTRRFKELTGLSLHQFIVKKRLTRARYLISVGVDPYRAAVDAGFNNYSHFSRTFKSYFGQNPSSIPKAHTIHVTADKS